MKKYYIVLAIIGISAFSFLPYVLAGPTTARPVEDWFITNPDMYWLPSEDYSFYPYREFIEFGVVKSYTFLDYEYSGKLTEKDTNDGYLKITCLIHGHGVPYMLTSPGNYPYVFGYMDYSMKVIYTIHVETWTNWIKDLGWMIGVIDDDGYIDGRIILPKQPMTVWAFWAQQCGLEAKTVQIVASGTGETVASFGDWIVGDSVKMHVNFVALRNPDGEWVRKVALMNVF